MDNQPMPPRGTGRRQDQRPVAGPRPTTPPVKPGAPSQQPGRFSPTSARPLPAEGSNDALLYVTREELPSWLRRSIDSGAGAVMFGVNIVESDTVPPLLIFHAWPVYRKPDHLVRPSAAVAECCALFPYIVETEEDSAELLDSFDRAVIIAEFFREALGALNEVQKRVWSFVAIRIDGTRAHCEGITRAKDPLPQLLDWLDSVGGRLCNMWQKLAATNQRKLERAPERFIVQLRVSNSNVRQLDAYALNPRHAAQAVTDKMNLADAYRRGIDRLAVKGAGVWEQFAIEEFYSDGQIRDALKTLDDAQRSAHREIRQQSAMLTARDAQVLREMRRNWLRHPFASLDSWWAERGMRQRTART